MAPPSTDRAPFMRPALTVVAAITALRVAALALNHTDLFVDESQYWLWARELEFGYYSKPPLIGWVIRLTTELGQSNSAFWVRLSAPLLHGVTAIFVGALTARFYDRRTADFAAMVYITLPLAAAGSVLISTDTIMLPFLVLALYFYAGILKKNSTFGAVAVGLTLGLAFLAKYAAVYFLISAVLAALTARQARPSPRDALVALSVFLFAISPNIFWNIENGMITVQHTLDNANWVRDPAARARLNLAGLAEFFFAQFIVFGPVTFAALLVVFTKYFRESLPGRVRHLVLFSLPILAIVCLQALLSRAYANWAVASFVSGTVLAIGLLSLHKRWLQLSFAVNGVICVLVLIAPIWALQITIPNGNLLMKRYLGRHDLSIAIIAAAKRAQITTIVAVNRNILADLFYQGRDQGLSIFSLPRQGRARNYYEQKYALPDARDEQVLFVTMKRSLPPCAQSPEMIEKIEPSFGAYRGKEIFMFGISSTCLGNAG